MRRHEARLQAVVLRALRRLRRDLFRDVDEATVHSALARLDDPAVITPFRDAIVAAIQAVALAGADFGREQVERFVYGTVKAVSGKQQSPLSVDWQLANNAAAQWALEYGYDLVRGITDTTRRRLQTEIQRFVTNGETLPQLTGRLEDVFGPVRAEMVAVTEVTRAYAEGNRASWRESGVIEQREWRTANDELVCPICGPLAGQIAGLDESFPDGSDGPPAHVRCRCWVVPVVTVD